MPSKKIILVLYTSHIGGMEKRFIDLFLYQMKERNEGFYLATTPMLIDKLFQFPDFVDLHLYQNNIILLSDSANRIVMLHQMVKLKWLNRGAIFHYVMKAPIFAFSHHSLFTFVHNSLAPYSFLLKLYYYHQFVFSKIVDILDPIVKQKISTLIPYKQSSIFETPLVGFTPPNIQPTPFSSRTNKVVFVSRFEKGKGIEELAQILPNIMYRLQKEGKDLSILFLGHGSLEYVVAKLKKDHPPLSIDYRFSNNPCNDIRDAKIFLSLQSYNNYPSRSLMEAMWMGLLPIISDSGCSRRMASENFAIFLSENYNEEELYQALFTTLTNSDVLNEKKSILAQQYVKENSSMKIMSDYYLSLYQKM